MKKLLLLSLISIGILTVSACYKDSDNTPPATTTTEKPDIIIETDVHGNFTNQSGEISDNYIIDINGESYEINQEVYSIQLEGAKKKNQHIAVSQNGIEVAFANVSLLENDNNKINIKAFPASETTILSNQENSFNLNNTFSIQTTSLSNEIEVTYKDISDDELIHQIGRWGTDSQGNNYFFNNSSAFYIDSETLSLQNNPLELTIKNPNNEQLSLFHLNDSFHQWLLVEDITQTNQSVNLPQLGYYILANTSNAIFSEGQLFYEQLPLAFQKLNLTSLESDSVALTSTASGRWSSFLPADIISQLSISDPCGNIIFQDELLVEESALHESSLTSEDASNILPINFKELKCDGETLLRPGALIDFGDSEEVMIFADEEVEIALLSCGDFTIRGYDVNDDVQGTEIPWSQGIEDNLDYLSVCQEYENGYSFLKINGEMEILPAFKIEKENDKTIFSSEDESIQLIIKGEGIGRYEEDQVNFYINNINFGENGYLMPCQNTLVGCGFDDCYISHYEEMSNGLTRITFSGDPWMQTIENPTAGYYEVEGQIIIKL